MRSTEQEVTLETAQELGLTAEEFERIKKLMGRTPNYTELSVYSVLWSEHCSHKNSVHWLKTLPREGRRLVAEAGKENAGLVDIGDGLACAFKIGSCNYPSAVEPYQGAAAGVGGIHRDIFTMGARPVAALNTLYFGNIESKHMRRLIRGVAAAVGDYGNGVGLPAVGGEVYFHDVYNQNILVNAMSVGLVRHDDTVGAAAHGPGNPVFIVGAATGKDGIHDAAIVSAGLTEDPPFDLPLVQAGDPLLEKHLLEASLEAVKTGAVVGMQDLGAAGISCSSAGMSARAKTGMRIDLDLVPTRQANLQAFEILLSQSQERMLIVGKKGEEAKLLEVFDKWDLRCEQIGEVTDSGRLEFYHHGELVAELDADSLVPGGGAPVYQREQKRPAYLKEIAEFKPARINRPKDYVETARQLFSSPNIVSKGWINEQYDRIAETNPTSANVPSDAALVRIDGARKALALTTGCNPAYVYADPYVGTMIAVAEAARNIVCSGGEPVAITNCLNFGNPYNPEVYWQFVNAIKGMGEACRKFDTPVVNGNVSFYNQSVFDDHTDPIYPTPTIGMVGILDDISNQMTLAFKKPGEQIYMLGTPSNDFNSSEYLRRIHGVEKSPPPRFDIDEEYHIQQNLKALIKSGMIITAHDISEGGLFVTLMESAMVNGLGYNIETDNNFRKDAYLFGESQGRIVITVLPENEDNLVNNLNSHNVSFSKLGEVTDDRVIIDDEDYGLISEWRTIYDTQLNTIMEK